MAIPASGSVSLSTIQSEWGGGNPISMSEYYSGSLASNSLVSSTSHTVSTSTGSQYFPATPGSKGVPGTAAYTSYYRQYGFKNSNVTTIPLGGFGSASATTTKVTGIDQVGEAGQIPSSGAIQFNHFRGTTGSGTSTNLVMYGFVLYHATSTLSGGSASSGFGNYSPYLWVSGHHGTTGTLGNNWSNVPFRYFDTPAKNGAPATRWYGSDTHVNNSINVAKQYCFHYTYPSIGAVTAYSYTTNQSTMLTMSGTWTITVQF
jgi:hypothetical protein